MLREALGGGVESRDVHKESFRIAAPRAAHQRFDWMELGSEQSLRPVVPTATQDRPPCKVILCLPTAASFIRIYSKQLGDYERLFRIEGAFLFLIQLLFGLHCGLWRGGRTGVKQLLAILRVGPSASRR